MILFCFKNTLYISTDIYDLNIVSKYSMKKIVVICGGGTWKK